MAVQPPRDVYPPEIWALESLMVLQNTHVAANLVHRDFEDEVAQFGDTINTRKPTKGTVLDLDNSTGSTLTADPVTATNVQLVLDKHKYTAWRLTERDMNTSVKNLVTEFMEPYLIPIAEQIDSDILAIDGGLCDPSFAAVDTTTANSGAKPVLAYDDLASVRGTLRSQQVPLRSSGGVPLVSGVLGVEFEEAILKVENFIKADTFGMNPPALRTGLIREVYGMSLYADQTVPTLSGAAGSSDDQAPFFHRNALGYVSRPLEQPPSNEVIRSAVVQKDGVGIRFIMSYEHTRLSWLCSFDILYGLKIFDTSLGCRLTHKDAY